MEIFAALLFVSSFIVFIAGMIKPNIVLRFMKSPNRVRVFLFSSAIGIVSLIIMAIVMPSDIEDKFIGTDTQQAQSQNNKQEQEEATIGKEVSIGFFAYTVNSIDFRKSVGNEFWGETADGIYLLIDLSVTNISNETRKLDNSCFYLTDANGVKYEYAINASTALDMSGYKSLFLKDCQPRIKTNGILIFEVPEKEYYYLYLAGSFFGTKSARILLK